MADANSMAHEQATHRVVVFAAPDDPRALRDLLVEKMGLHSTDAQIRAHAVPGMLPDTLSQSKAEELATAIEALGVRAAAISADEMPHFEHAEVLHHVRCLDSGLEVIELHGEPECLVAWDDIQLISVGYMPQEGRHRYQIDSTAVIHSAPQPHRDSPKVPPMSGPEAWIIRRDPQTGFRIEHNEMNYEYLGKRKTGSATHNFRVFLEDLIAKTPQAYVTPAARAYLGHGLLRHYEFQSLEEHRRYTVFHLLLLHRMHPPD